MNGDRRAVETRCRERVLQCHMPENQRELIDSAVDGIPASEIVSQARLLSPVRFAGAGSETFGSE